MQGDVYLPSGIKSSSQEQAHIIIFKVKFNYAKLTSCNDVDRDINYKY